MGLSAVPTPHRGRISLVCGIVALALVVVLPPVAWIPGLVAVVLGADARDRDRSMGRSDLSASLGMALGAIAIAVAVALVVAAAGGG
jgi:hypothetical protein